MAARSKRMGDGRASGLHNPLMSEASLLAAAMEQGLERHAVTQPKCADALGPMHLVARKRDHVTGLERHRHTAETLHGVTEEESTALARDRAQFRDRLDNTDLVVHEHRGQ